MKKIRFKDRTQLIDKCYKCPLFRDGYPSCTGGCMMNVDYEIIPGNCPLEDVEYPKNLLVRCMASPEVSCPHRAAPGICGLEDTDCVYAIIYRLR